LSLHFFPCRSEINRISQPPAVTTIKIVLEVRGVADSAGEVRKHSFHFMMIYFIAA
jgi:hypothetical protein